MYKRQVYALGLAAGKDADMRRAEQGSVIDPLLYIGNLRVALGPFGQGKIITDGGAADIHPAQKRMPPKVCQIFGRDVVPEKVAGEFGAFAAVVGAKVDKLEQVHRSIGDLAHGSFLIFEKTAERISRQAEAQLGLAGTLERCA